MGKFKAADRVVCINTVMLNEWNDLTLYKTYTVVNTFMNSDRIVIVTDSKIGRRNTYNSKLFVSLQEYRRMKLEKLKDKICSKLVIK